MHNGKFFLSQGHGGPKFVKYGPTFDRYAPTVSTEGNGGFDNMSPLDIPKTEPELSVSSHGLGHVTPNFGYLAQLAKCSLNSLGRGLSNVDEIWYVDRGRCVVHDNIMSLVEIKRFLIFTKSDPTQNR